MKKMLIILFILCNSAVAFSTVESETRSFSGIDLFGIEASDIVDMMARGFTCLPVGTYGPEWNKVAIGFQCIDRNSYHYDEKFYGQDAISDCDAACSGY